MEAASKLSHIKVNTIITIIYDFNVFLPFVTEIFFGLHNEMKQTFNFSPNPEIGFGKIKPLLIQVAKLDTDSFKRTVTCLKGYE